MIHSSVIHRWSLAGVLLLAMAPARAADLSLLASYSSGDYGNAVESDVQSTWLRFATGDRYQFRVAGSYLRIETTEGLVQPHLGVVPVARGRAKGQANTSGSGAGNQTGPGSGTDASDLGGESSSLPTFPVTTSSDGMGDIWLSGFVRILGGNAKIYRLDTGIELKAPTADPDELLGTGEWDVRFAVSGEYYFWTASTFAAIGWNRLGDPDWIDFKDPLDFVAGGESEPLWDRYIVSGWFEGNQETVEGTGDRTALGLGIRSTGRFRWRLMATAGLGGSAETFSLSFGLSMGVEPPKTGLGGLAL